MTTSVRGAPGAGRGSHWDWLALTSDAWSRLGTSPDSLLPFVHHLRSPVGVVGSGTGVIQRWLAGRGYRAVGVDRSAGMLAEARKLGTSGVVRADGGSLPFRTGSLGSVVVTTGVLDTADRARRRAILSEALRVLEVGGRALVGVFRPTRAAVEAGEAIGYMTGARLDYRRVTQLWECGGSPSAQAELVARWRGLPEAEAADLVARHASLLHAVHAGVQEVAAAAARRGLHPREYLRNGLDYALEGRPLREHRRAIHRLGGRVLEVRYQPAVSTATLLVAGPDLPTRPSRPRPAGACSGS